MPLVSLISTVCLCLHCFLSSFTCIGIRAQASKLGINGCDNSSHGTGFSATNSVVKTGCRNARWALRSHRCQANGLQLCALLPACNAIRVGSVVSLLPMHLKFPSCPGCGGLVVEPPAPSLLFVARPIQAPRLNASA